MCLRPIKQRINTNLLGTVKVSGTVMRNVANVGKLNKDISVHKKPTNKLNIQPALMNREMLANIVHKAPEIAAATKPTKPEEADDDDRAALTLPVKDVC